MHVAIREASRQLHFCSSPDLSGEHIWPQWAAPILGHKGYRGKRVEGFIVRTKKTQTISQQFKNRHGHTANKRIYAVCAACNTTWMSALELNAKDIAGPMMNGDLIDLSPKMQRTLAEWIALKVLVAEHHQKDDYVFSQSMRSEFMKSRSLPTGMSLWIGRCMDPAFASLFVRHAALINLSDDVPPSSVGKNTQTTTIGIGQLFILSLACITEGVSLEDFFSFGPALTRLWPLSGEPIIWPPMRILTGKQAHAAAFILDTLIHNPRVLWSNR